MKKISEREPEATIKVGTGQMKGVLVAKHNGNKDRGNVYRKVYLKPP